MLSVGAVHHVVVPVDVAPAVHHDVLAGPQVKEDAAVVSFGDTDFNGSAGEPHRLKEQREHVAVHGLDHDIRTVVRASWP